MPNRYTEVHANPSGPGDARPTGVQIVHDENLVGALPDKVVLITGTSSGIGIDTVKAAALTGATVYCAVRDLAKGEKALSHLLKPGKVELLKMDNGSMASVRAGAAEFLERSGGKLNILICNAGIMMLPKRTLTEDGFEAQFGTNHMAHFLLFQLVKDAMLASSTPEYQSRAVFLASSGHRFGMPNFGDYNYTADESKYDPNAAYGQSKCANIYTANQIERLYGAQGLHGLSVMPGGIWTGLQANMDQTLLAGMKQHPAFAKIMKSPAQGCATTIYAAFSKDWEGKGGKYLESCDESPMMEESGLDAPTQGAMAYAYNQENEERLWADSLEMLGMKA